METSDGSSDGRFRAGLTLNTFAENGNFLGGQPGVDETLSYDAFNRLVGYSGAAASKTTTFAYTNRGELSQIVYPVSGATIAYTYDALRQINEMAELGQGLIASYDYRGPGRVERRTLDANGTRTDYAFDGRGRTIGTTHLDVSTSAVFDDRAYTWDRVSNKLTRTRLDPVTGQPLLTHTYDYDGLDRLESATRTPAGQAASMTNYTLDPSGNRTSVAGGPDPGAYTQTQPPGSRVHEYAATPVAPYARTHDDNGNFLGGQPGVDETLIYDAFNRLVGYSGAGGSPAAAYTYDAFGRRIQKIVVDASGAVTTRYVYHGDRVIEEMNEAGTALVASYVYGNDIDEVLRMRRDTDGTGGPENYYYHTDDLFNVVALTDQTGAVVERYDYGDYGAPEIYDAAGAPRAATAYGNTRLFQSRDYDAETGLYYFRARYLDPLTGRFTSRDPLGIWADVLNLGNGYTYAGNNPWSMRDPFGLESGGNEKSWWDRFKESAEGLIDKWNGMWEGLGEMFASGGYDPFEDDSLVDLIDAISLGEYEGDYTGVYGGMALQQASARWKAGAVEIGVNMVSLGLELYAGKVVGDLLGKALGAVARPLLRGLGAGLAKGIGLGRYAVGSAAGRLAGFGARGVGASPAGVTRLMPPVCFVAGTLIATAAGGEPIEEIEAGDLVFARDEATGEVAEYEVARTFVTEDQQYLEVKFGVDGDDSEPIGVTPEHPFWVKNQGWTAADDLAPGDQVMTLDGGWLRVGSKTRAQTRATVYNFEVKTAHTYFVGESALWVHNSCSQVLPQGSFSISNWKGYPAHVPKPAGPFRLIRGEEYDAARNLANRTNAEIRGGHPAFSGKQIHEIHPIKFGGSPTDLSNKIPLTQSQHARLNQWWARMQRDIEKYE